MDKVRLRVGDLVRKWRQSVLETGILLKRHEAKSFETDCDVVVWDIHGWTKPKRAIESALNQTKSYSAGTDKAAPKDAKASIRTTRRAENPSG